MAAADQAPAGVQPVVSPGRASLAAGSSPWMTLIASLAAVSAMGVSGVAQAQQVAGPESYYPTNVPVGVRERARPDYAALGIPLGAFELYPTLLVTPQYDDNIFVTDHGQTSDLITAVSPSLTLTSNWARNALTASVGSTSNLYAQNGSQNTTDYQLSGSGRLDVLTQSNVSGAFFYSHATEPRTAEDSVSTGAVPVQYDSYGGNIGSLQTITRLRFSETFNVTRSSYNNTSLNAQDQTNLEYLNNNVYAVTGRADYAFDPNVSMYLSASANDRAYDFRPPTVRLDRNSSGVEVDVGSSFNITQLVTGQAQIGYLQQNYHSASFHAVSGPAARINVQYYPDELTTISANLNRSVIDAEDPNAISFLQTKGSVQVDHELFPNLIVSGQAGYETDSFRGVQREDRRPSASLSATYLMNRHVGLTGGYSFISEDSSGAARIGHYAVNVLSLALTLQL